MTRKIKLGWNESQKRSPYDAAIEALASGGVKKKYPEGWWNRLGVEIHEESEVDGLEIHEEIEKTYGSDFDLPYKYENNNSSNLVLKGELLKISGTGLFDVKYHHHKISNVTLRWMMYKGRIFTYAFLHPVPPSSRGGFVERPFVFMARRPLNMKTKNVVLDDITSGWRQIR